jgi:hypothetical protein
MRNSVVCSIAGILLAGVMAPALAEPDCAYRKETEAARTLRLTVCLNGEPDSEGPIVGGISLQVQNIGDHAIELRAYADPVELFRAVISGAEGQIMKSVRAPRMDSPESREAIQWRHFKLLPGESFVQAAHIGELLEARPRVGRRYTIWVSPGVSFRTAEMASFHDGSVQMSNDKNYERPLKFENVRLGGGS